MRVAYIFIYNICDAESIRRMTIRVYVFSGENQRRICIWSEFKIARLHYSFHMRSFETLRIVESEFTNAN